MSIALLTASNISFAYGDQPILRAVSLAVEAGELVGLIGPNGSGKTTLLRLLLGLASSPTGEVQLGAEPISSLSRRQIALRAAMVQQETRLDFAFTGREIVAMGRTPHLGRFKAETAADKNAIEEAMRSTETDCFADRFVTELSGGERQLIQLARALAQQTDLILLDEPTANLDLAHQFQILTLLKSATHGGKGVLAAIHDLPLAAHFCDRLVLLSETKLAIAGPPSEVLTEENLAAHFGLRARVFREQQTGFLQIIPLGADRSRGEIPNDRQKSGPEGAESRGNQ